MAGAFKMEVELKGVRYVLNRAAAAELLKAVDAFGEECGEPCKRLRADLRRALALTNPDGREAEVVEEHAFTVEVRVDQAQSQEKQEAHGPRCWFCGEEVSVVEGTQGSSDPLYTCRNAACHGGKRPAVASHYDCGTGENWMASERRG